MVTAHTSYRSFLRSELVERQRRNSAYSMRAFARLLGLSQSAVSQVMAGKRHLLPSTAQQISSKLQLRPKDSEYFCLLVRLEGSRDPLFREVLLQKLSTLNPELQAHELAIDQFRAIADWYHFALRNLIETDGVEDSFAGLAKRLGITALEAQTALERLERLELVRRDPKTGRFRKTVRSLSVKSKGPNEALRLFYEQMLRKAMDAIREQPPAERVNGSETFAFAPEHLEEARSLTQEYFQKMTALVQKPGKRTHVYHLGVQFFSLTPETPHA